MISFIPAEYYHATYLIVLSILTIIFLRRYIVLGDDFIDYNGRDSGLTLFVITLFFTFFIGLRPIDGSSFVDMGNYYDYWNSINYYSFTWDTDNIIFDNLFGLMASNDVDFTVFMLLLSSIYFGGIAFSVSKLFPNDKTISALVYFSAFSTFSYGTNGMKAGVAASLFLVAIAMHKGRKHILAIIFLAICYGFHHSMQLPIIAYLICIFIKNPKIFLSLWFFSFLVALLRIKYFQVLFAGFTDDQGASYLLGGGETVMNHILGGFRIDFILYGIVPIVVGCIAYFNKGIKSKEYLFLLNLYILTNSIWLLCMYAEFNNRIAYLSWLMYPIVLIYPILNENWGKMKYDVFRKLAYGHLAFTLFMTFIYYA